MDAVAFIAGMVAGIGLFAGAFEDLFTFYTAGKGPQAQTLDQLLGLPVPVILIGLIAMAAGAFRLGSHFERKLGGPISIQDIFEEHQKR
ncbi:MAG: hypothetical protein O2807_04240 [bacterium]|nr:hypothetical protein [bacterium]